MMEATKLNWPVWWLFFLLCLTYIPSVFPVHAQPSDKDTTFYRLLDSVEMLKLRREFEKAIEVCSRIRTESKTIDDWGSQVRCLNELADIHRNMGELKKAESFLQESHDMIIQHSLESSIEYSRNVFYAGKLLRSRNIDELESVKDSILNNYSFAKKMIGKAFPTSYNFHADLLMEIGYFNKLIGRHDVTVSYYNELVNLLQNHFETVDYRRGLYLLFVAIYYYDAGDYERSTILSQIASYIMHSQNVYDFRRYIDCEQVIANNYFETQKYHKAVEHYDEMINLMEAEYGIMDPELIEPCMNVCQPLLNIGQYDKSIRFSNRSIQIIEANPSFKDKLYFIYNNLAEAYEKKSDFKNAERFFEETINARIKLFGLRHEEVYEGYRYFAEYYERRGLYRRALEYYQKSLDALFKDFSPTGIYENPDFNLYSNIEQLFYVLFGKSGTLYKLYGQTNDLRDLESSYKLYLIVYQLLDDFLDKNYLDRSSMQLFKRFHEGFNLSIDCAVRLFKISRDNQYLEQAFQFIEKNKYFLLYKALLMSDQGDDFYSDAAGLSEKLIKKDIDNLRQIITGVSNPDSLFVLRNRLIQKLTEKDIVKIVQTRDKSLYVGSDKEVLNIRDAQSLLSDEKEMLIEYHWSNEHVYAFLIGKEIADILVIEKKPPLLSRIDLFAGALSNQHNPGIDFKKYTTSAYFLYSNLILPVEDLISKKIPDNNINRLIIVPDGPLSTLPFEAFISRLDTTSNNYWGLDYLCRKYVMNYAYSLNILQNNLALKKVTSKPKMLALSYSKRFDKAVDIGQLRSENELPYSGDEIQRISKRIKSTCFSGNEASEAIFKERAPEYSIIHLALHGQADTTDMFNSRLIFKKDPNSNEDGELRAYELYDMDLTKLQMVVLSACETGIGKQYEGEGIFSIARGFAYAGCPSIIMSLWKVSDKATADLIDLFYANLEKSMPKDEALRNAKLTFIRNAVDINAHPANWAAFISLGNNQPLVLPKSSFQWYYIVLLMGVTIVLWLALRNSQVKSRWD